MLTALKKLPWWAWVALVVGISIPILIASGALKGLFAAAAGLIASGVAAHRADRKARRVSADLQERIEVEKSEVDALNSSQDKDLAAVSEPTTAAPSSAEDAARRRKLVEDPWTEG